MALNVRLLPILLLVAASPGATAREPMEALREAFEACKHPGMEYPRARNYDPDRDLRLRLTAMLRAPKNACPGTPGLAVIFLRQAVGDPVRPDADPSLIEMLRMAAHDGTGMAPDPALSFALHRHLWLIGGEREVSGWNESERQAWLSDPDTIALLEARVAAAPTARSIWLLANLRLRRDIPGYDPKRAAALLEKSPEIHQDLVRTRLASLLIEGEHLPRDFTRAAKPFRYDAVRQTQDRAPAQRVLLDIGRRAAAAARTPLERLQALSILAPASLDGIADSRAVYERLLGRIKAARDTSVLPKDRLDWISAELDIGFAYNFDMLPDETAPGLRPIELDGLVGPDGRLVTVSLTQSSGVPVRDRAVVAIYLWNGPKVDFSTVVKGRATWIRLPPVDPMLSYETVYARRRERCPACM